MNISKSCREIEKLDKSSRQLLFARALVDSLSGLNNILNDEGTSSGVLLHLIFAAVIADGKLEYDEYELIKPFLDTFEDNCSFEHAKLIINNFKNDSTKFKNGIDEIVDIIGIASTELKANLIVVCLTVCGIDGKISFKERRYIKQLIK